METLQRDMLEMLNVSGRDKGVTVDEKRRLVDALGERHDHGFANVSQPLLLQRSRRLENRVRNVYAQDWICFGR